MGTPGYCVWQCHLWWLGLRSLFQDFYPGTTLHLCFARLSCHLSDDTEVVPPLEGLVQCSVTHMALVVELVSWERATKEPNDFILIIYINEYVYIFIYILFIIYFLFIHM